jgi:hypothetical protein
MAVQDFELRASHLPGRCSPLEPLVQLSKSIFCHVEKWQQGMGTVVQELLMIALCIIASTWKEIKCLSIGQWTNNGIFKP